MFPVAKCSPQTRSRFRGFALANCVLHANINNMHGHVCTSTFIGSLQCELQWRGSSGPRKHNRACLPCDTILQKGFQYGVRKGKRKMENEVMLWVQGVSLRRGLKSFFLAPLYFTLNHFQEVSQSHKTNWWPHYFCNEDGTQNCNPGIFLPLRLLRCVSCWSVSCPILSRYWTEFELTTTHLTTSFATKCLRLKLSDLGLDPISAKLFFQTEVEWKWFSNQGSNRAPCDCRKSFYLFWIVGTDWDLTAALNRTALLESLLRSSSSKDHDYWVHLLPRLW